MQAVLDRVTEPQNFTSDYNSRLGFLVIADDQKQYYLHVQSNRALISEQIKDVKITKPDRRFTNNINIAVGVYYALQTLAKEEISGRVVLLEMNETSEPKEIIAPTIQSLENSQIHTLSFLVEV